MLSKLFRIRNVAYLIITVIVIFYSSEMYFGGSEYTRDASIAMGSFPRTADWLSAHLGKSDYALVPNPVVFQVLKPEIKDNLLGYKKIWDAYGVVLKADTTDYQAKLVKDSLTDLLNGRTLIRYLVIDWIYPYSNKLFTNRSCDDFGSVLRVAATFDFVQPASRWHSLWKNKITVCEVSLH